MNDEMIRNWVCCNWVRDETRRFFTAEVSAQFFFQTPLNDVDVELRRQLGLFLNVFFEWRGHLFMQISHLHAATYIRNASCRVSLRSQRVRSELRPLMNRYIVNSNQHV